MSFNDLAAGAANAQWQILGEVVSYHQRGGKVSTIQAIIDQDVEVYPGGFESSTPERRNEISLLKTSVPHIKAGELIVSETDTFELCDLISDRGPVIVYTARVINNG